MNQRNANVQEQRQVLKKLGLRRARGMRMLAALALLLALAGLAAAAGADELPGASIYRLPVALADQDGHDFRLADRRGTPQLVSMFYTSCQYVCPLIIDTMSKTEHALSAAEQARLEMLLVSFDPDRDSVARLHEVFGERKLDANRWTLARTDAAAVRKLAAVLGVQYRALANREINHSTSIVLLDGEGRIVARTDKLGAIDPEFVAALHKALGAGS
jgi:protein SCO1/2